MGEAKTGGPYTREPWGRKKFNERKRILKRSKNWGDWVRGKKRAREEGDLKQKQGKGGGVSQTKRPLGKKNKINRKEGQSDAHKSREKGTRARLNRGG